MGVLGGGVLQNEYWRRKRRKEEESSLKWLVKIMKTNGDGVSRDGEEDFICESSSPGIQLCHSTAASSGWWRAGAALSPPLGREKLSRRKMRALNVIIVQGQLFPRWSKSG